MAIVEVSPKFEIALPKAICEELKIVAGQKLNISIRNGFICLSPTRSLQSLRGIATGMSWKDDDRDHSDRF